MRFGIALPLSHQGLYLPRSFASPHQLVELARFAERLGYYSAWGLDLMTPREPSPSERPERYEIVTALSFIAALTSDIRLGSAPIQLPLRDPLLLARQFATMHNLSGGRMLLGVRMGCDRQELAAMCPHRAEVDRGDIANAHLQAVIRFLTEDSVSIDDPLYRCVDLCALPKPLRHLPIYLADRSNVAPQRVAALADGWLLSRADSGLLDAMLAELRYHLDEAMRDPKDIDLVVTRGLVIAPTEEKAMSRFQASLLPSKMNSLAAASGRADEVSRDPEKIHQQNLLGTPDQIVEKLSAIAEKEISHCILYYYAAEELDEMRDQIEWFAAEVMPRLETRRPSARRGEKRADTR